LPTALTRSSSSTEASRRGGGSRTSRRCARTPIGSTSTWSTRSSAATSRRRSLCDAPSRWPTTFPRRSACSRKGARCPRRASCRRTSPATIRTGS
jgi:hypothetical protein